MTAIVVRTLAFACLVGLLFVPLEHVFGERTGQRRGRTTDLLFATVERSKPELAQRFLFVSAVADEPRFQHFLGTVEAPVLLKPVAVESLLAEIERLTR